MKGKEDHRYTVIEPGSHFAGHFTSETWRAKNVSTGFIIFFKNVGDDIKNLIVVGYDSTVANTEVKTKKSI